MEADLNQTLMTAGTLSLILGCVMVYYYTRSKRLIDEMWAVDTYTARDLRLLCSGDFSAIVEVEGIIECDNPLISPAAKIPCCWCHTKIESEECAPNGGKCWRTTFEETKSTLFKVCDKTGFTLVEPLDADIDAARIFFDTVNRMQALSISSRIGTSDTGDYRITEEALHDGGYAYVLGLAACTQRGTSPDVLIRKADQGYADVKRGHFIISRKSEKELTTQYGISTTLCYYMAAISFAVTLFSALCLTGVVDIGAL